MKCPRGLAVDLVISVKTEFVWMTCTFEEDSDANVERISPDSIVISRRTSPYLIGTT